MFASVQRRLGSTPGVKRFVLTESRDGVVDSVLIVAVTSPELSLLPGPVVAVFRRRGAFSGSRRVARFDVSRKSCRVGRLESRLQL